MDQESGSPADNSRSLRILHLSDNYPPSKGGLERSVQSLAKVQVEAGHSVTIATTELAGEPRLSVEDGVTVHRLPYLLRRLPGTYKNEERVYFPPVPEPMFERALMRVTEQNPPDVVHVHGWILYSALGPARRLGAAVVATAHDYGSVCALKTLYREDGLCSGPGFSKCIRCAFGSYGPKGVPIAAGMHLASYRHKKVDEWTALSSAVASAGSSVRPKDRMEMTVIPSFVPDSVANVDRSVARPSFVPDNGPYLFFVGALGSHKGVHVLLAAHRNLWNEGTRIPLVLAGMPSPHQDFELDQPGLTVVMNIPHDSVMAGWVNAAVGVVPSVWGEPFGQVAVECLAAGTPLVVTRVGGLPDIVDEGGCGLIVEPDDPAQLAEAIRTLLADADLAQRLSEAGRQRARMFTASAVQAKVEQSYRRALVAHHSLKRI